MKTLALISGTLLLSAAALAVPPSSPAAKSVLVNAEMVARAEHKNVMLIFHASWCGWCEKFDQFLSDPKMAKIMNANYEIIHIDGLENGDKKSLENPGWDSMMDQYGAKDAGIPFYVFLTPGGKILGTSAKPGPGPAAQRNIGYPGAPAEIDYFMGLLKTSAPHLTSSQSSAMKNYLVTNAPH